MRKEGRRGVMHVVDAFVFSMKGLRTAWANETAFRLQCALLVPLVPLACLIAQSAVELSLLLGACGLVLMAEMFNSAIERLVDRVGTDIHPLSGQAKDLGSAGVFIAMMLFLVVWLPIGWANLRG
jgi:diacylglycerol kinase (ATP)